jgi:hypothetical protein
MAADEEAPREHESVVFFGLLARPHRGALRSLAPESVGALQPRVEREGAVGGDEQRVLQEGKDNGALCSSRPVDGRQSRVQACRRYTTLLYAREEDHAARTATGLVLHTKRSRQDGDDRRSRAATPAATTVMTKARPRNMWQSCLPGQRLRA